MILRNYQLVHSEGSRMLSSGPLRYPIRTIIISIDSLLVSLMILEYFHSVKLRLLDKIWGKYALSLLLLVCTSERGGSPAKFRELHHFCSSRLDADHDATMELLSSLTHLAEDAIQENNMHFVYLSTNTVLNLCYGLETLIRSSNNRGKPSITVHYWSLGNIQANKGQEPWKYPLLDRCEEGGGGVLAPQAGGSRLLIDPAKTAGGLKAWLLEW